MTHVTRAGGIEAGAYPVEASASAEAITSAQAGIPLSLPLAPKYRTIVADPPWPIAWRGSSAIGKKPLAYPTLTIAEIVALPVRDIADDASNLYLWTTNQFLPEALGVVRAWGFQYRLLWTWCKNNGIGGHPRNATEHIVIASRGETPSIGRHEKATLNWLVAPRGRHSEKPAEFMDLIERFSPTPRVELFARRQRLGWDTWGNEALEHVEIGGAA